jgi:hypothetical protein
MSTTSLLKPSFEIDAASWTSFVQHISTSYPKSTFTDEQTDFVLKSLLNGPNRTCPDSNKYWVNVFAGHLIECVGELGWPTESETTVVQKIEFLQLATGKAILGYFNSQIAIRQTVVPEQRSIDQKHMLNVHPNLFNFPIDLTLDFGRLLNLPIKSTDSNKPLDVQAEAISDQQLFHRLYHQILQQLATAYANDACANQIESQLEQEEYLERCEIADHWSSYSVEDKFLRMCCHKVAINTWLQFSR